MADIGLPPMGTIMSKFNGSTVMPMPNGISEAKIMGKVSKKVLPKGFKLRPSPDPRTSVQNLGICAVESRNTQPENQYYGLHRWSTGNLGKYFAPTTTAGTVPAAQQRPKPAHVRRAKAGLETTNSIRAIEFDHPLGSRSDSVLHPPRRNKPWTANERILDLLRPATMSSDLMSMTASWSSSDLLAGRDTHHELAARTTPLPFCSSLDREFMMAPSSRSRLQSEYGSKFCMPKHGRAWHPGECLRPLRTGDHKPRLNEGGCPPCRQLPPDKLYCGMPETVWRLGSRSTASEAQAGRAWGPPQEDNMKESRSASEW